MVDLRLAGEECYPELREFRKRIFAHELQIQNEDYQDVFNDYFSKNVILRKPDGTLIGAARLAFSREKQKFYISYLTLSAEGRTGSYVRLLLGAIFYLARKNGVFVLHGDATDDNLPMYLAAGCRQAGRKYRKYGFRTEWTPIEYVMGTQGRGEDILIARARPYLEDQDCLWRFRPGLLLCSDDRQYRAGVARLIADRRIFGNIPHLGEAFATGSEAVSLDTVLAPELADTSSDHRGELAAAFEAFNRSFNDRHVLVIPRESRYLDIARVYALLTGKKLAAMDEWSPSADLESVMLILQPTELASFRRILGDRSRDWLLGFACADSPSALSQMLIRNYLEFLSPCDRPEPGVYPTDRLREHGRDGGALRPALDGSASHVVLCDAARAAIGELQDRLAGLLRTGLPIGAAVRSLESAGPAAGSDRPRQHCLIGDPCLAFRSKVVGEPVVDRAIETRASS